MLRKGFEQQKGDKEVLLDLDYGGEVQNTDSYGSLQNGSFIPPRYVSAVSLYQIAPQHVFLTHRTHSDINNSAAFLHHTEFSR